MAQRRGLKEDPSGTPNDNEAPEAVYTEPEQGQRENLTDGEARERTDPSDKRDRLWVSPRKMQEWDIKANETLICVRNPDRYADAENVDRIDVVLDTYDTARLVTHPKDESKVMKHHDLVYIAVDKDEFARKKQARIDQAAVELYNGLGRPKGQRKVGGTSQTGPMEEFSEDYASLQNARQHWQDQIHSMGFIQPNPHGFSLEEIERKRGPEGVREDEYNAAHGMVSMRRAERAEMRREQEERSGGKSKNRTYSMPGRPTR